ncbi:MAG: hypothetical protein WDA42_00850 [Candidatus Bathyarchaeia archaeon]
MKGETSMATKKRFIEGVLFEAERGPYDPSKPKYAYYVPVHTGDYSICDCWVTDAYGNTHPGYSNSPVPISIDDLGSPVANLMRS